VHERGVVPSTEEALEDLVHQKRGPDERLEDGQQLLAERVRLLPGEDQRTNQAQRVDGVASTCAGLIHAALTIRGPCKIGHSHSPTVCELTVRRPARSARPTVVRTWFRQSRTYRDQLPAVVSPFAVIIDARRNSAFHGWLECSF
jgi:hypothetical protein